MKRTYETCGKEFTTRKAAERHARNIANASNLKVPVYETTGAKVAEHTPGPWRVGDACHTIFGPPNGTPCPAVIAEVHGGKSVRDSWKANGRLIAAAPDLLAACKAVRDGWEGNLSEAIAMVNDAIDRAES